MHSNKIEIKGVKMKEPGVQLSGPTKVPTPTAHAPTRNG